MKRICPMFSRIIEHYKCQGSFFKGSQDVLSFTVELSRAFFQGPKKLLKTQVFEEKGLFSSERKIIWPVFRVLSSMTKLKEQFVRVHTFSLRLL